MCTRRKRLKGAFKFERDPLVLSPMQSALSRSGFRTIADWIWEGKRFAAATLVAADGNEVPALGATLAVDAERNIAGDIAAGCYEATIVHMCLQTLNDGVGREFATATGAGAKLRIVIWIPDRDFGASAVAIASGEEDVLFSLPVQPAISFAIPRRRRIVVVGATSVAREIAVLGKALDFRVVVVDPRPAVAATMRAPEPRHLISARPADVLPLLLVEPVPVLVSAHDPEIDACALGCALQSKSPYIALLGCVCAKQTTYELLRRAGFDETSTSRIRAPAETHHGGRTAAEIALLILPELINLDSSRAVMV